MRIDEERLISKYLGRYCVINRCSIVNPQVLFLIGQVCEIIGFDSHHAHLNILDKSIGPSGTNMISTCFDTLELADFQKGDVLINDDGIEFTLESISRYDEDEGFIWYVESANPRSFDVTEGHLKRQNYVKRNRFPDIDLDKPTCQHLNKYKNIVSTSLKFWVCPDCGQDWDIKE